MNSLSVLFLSFSNILIFLNFFKFLLTFVFQSVTMWNNKIFLSKIQSISDKIIQTTVEYKNSKAGIFLSLPCSIYIIIIITEGMWSQWLSIAVSQTLSRSTKESRFIENECKQKKQLSTHWEHSHAVTYQSASNRHRWKYSPLFWHSVQQRKLILQQNKRQPASRWLIRLRRI